MNARDLKALLALGEGQRVEFKVQSDPNVVGPVVCGFLNTSGGFLVCGVDERKGVVGVTSNPKEALAHLESALAQHITPKAYIAFEELEVEGKSLIIVEVPKGEDVPYAIQGSIYVRRGEENQKADMPTIRDLVMRRQIEPERWERRFSMADMERDVDDREVLDTPVHASRSQQVIFRNSKSVNDILEDLAVARYGRLTQAGDVLFARHPEARYPQVRARAVRYRSSRADEQFLDMRIFEGPLRQIFMNLYAFVLRNIPTIAQFRPSTPERDDRLLYPETVIREAIVNALAHRDYSSPTGGVAVHIYPDRLEFWNSGQLPEGVTPDNLMKGHLSILRNPDLAHVLYVRGLMEKVGRGSVLIVQHCSEAKLPPPEWTTGDEGVRLILRAPEVTPEVTPEATPEVTPEVIRMIGSISAPMARTEIMAQLGLRDEKHMREHYLQPALDAGVIEMTVPDKPRSRNQKYRLTSLGRKIASQAKENQRD
ncbi:transcriptional regulator [bacterium]|nr:transcriptional regulator [bacterium]